MGLMNPLNTFLSLARLLRDLGQELSNGVVSGGGGGWVVINLLSAKDILFGKKVHKDNLFINHILLVGKHI